jgi:hypothetical protein
LPLGAERLSFRSGSVSSLTQPLDERFASFLLLEAPNALGDRG